MERPRLLDLFCGGGGAAAGYERAGFDVTGVDIAPMPRFPFRCWQADALKLPEWVFSAFDAVHASPPCQAFSSLRHTSAREQQDLIVPVRRLLEQSGLPYVIENVPGAPLRRDVVLCGSGLGLPRVECLDGKVRQVRRHRVFEVGGFVPPLVPPCAHTTEALGVYGSGRWNNNERGRDGRRGGYQGNGDEKRAGLDAPWLSSYESSQAIPPAYTELIGQALLAQIPRPTPR